MVRLRLWWQISSILRWSWQKIQPHPFIAIGILVLLMALIAFVLAVHWGGWDWTGFNGYSPPTPQYQRGKTLWDWLNLLGVFAIPAVVGLGAAWYTAQQGKVSDRENTDNQRETALQQYIDKMSELLLEKHLRESSPEDEVRKIARVRTLTVLRGLDPIRKASVIQFLHESGLIDKEKCIISLSGANLSGTHLRRAHLSAADLGKANLGKANLIGAHLEEADLREADLNGADLLFAFLSGANLSEAHLSRANLIGAILSPANLSNADLSNADLSSANLSEAHLSEAHLKGATGIPVEELEKQAESLEGATLPNGEVHS